MANTDSTVATLLDELAALDAAQRHELYGQPFFLCLSCASAAVVVRNTTARSAVVATDGRSDRSSPVVLKISCNAASSRRP